MIIILLCPQISHSQIPDSTLEQVQQMVQEDYVEFNLTGNHSDPEEYIQMLQDLAMNPVNLNTADMNDLIKIPAIDDRIAQAIITYRDHIKPFESIKEVQNVKGIGNVTFRKIKPFITIGDGRNIRKIMVSDPHYWTYKGHLAYISRLRTILQEPLGYRDISQHTHYAGNRMKYYQKLAWQSPHLSLHITQQKDAGERMDGKLGFDYTSFSLALRNIMRLHEIVIGDYSLSFGQGLLLWNGFGFGKGSSVVNGPVRNGRGVHSYGSSDENHFLRGIAFTYGKKLQTTFFLSRRNLSASVIAGDTVRNPSMTGLYRTPTELKRRYNTGTNLAGTHIAYNTQLGEVGLTGYYMWFNRYIEAGSSIYQYYDFHGMRLSGLSIDYRYLIHNSSFFGEIARSGNGAIALLSGMKFPVSQQTDLVFLYRNYSKSFWSFYGSAFGEQSGPPQNEVGFYIGIRHDFTHRLSVGTYFDQYHFPFARYRVSESSGGYDWLGSIKYYRNDKLTLSLLGKYEQKQQDVKNVDGFGRDIVRLGWHKRGSVRLQLDYAAGKLIRLQTRVEGVRSRVTGSKANYGLLISQDLRWQVSPHLNIQGRIMTFDTDNYDARIYEYENDLLYVMYTPSFSGKGERSYVVMKYSPCHYLTIYAKYDVTVFENEWYIGSGLDRIKGNKRSHFGVEMRIRF
jgi:competence ComEA-like helix-hairpin-helix protein